MCSAFCGPVSNVAHLCFPDYRPAIVGSPNDLGMLANPVEVSAQDALGMEARPMAITTRQALGMQSRTVAVASRSAVSVFSDGVSLVIGVSAKEEMVWSDAGRIVAMMQDIRTVGDRPDEFGIGEPMRPDGAVADSERPVSARFMTRRFGASPDPALWGNSHLGPESREFGHVGSISPIEYLASAD